MSWGRGCLDGEVGAIDTTYWGDGPRGGESLVYHHVGSTDDPHRSGGPILLCGNGLMRIHGLCEHWYGIHGVMQVCFVSLLLLFQIMFLK